MKQEDYIKAIEELNSEYIDFYFSDEYKAYRSKEKKRMLFKAKKYKELIQYDMQLRKKRRKRRIQKIKRIFKRLRKLVRKIFKAIRKIVRKFFKKLKRLIRKIVKRIIRIIFRRIFRCVKKIKNRELKKKLLKIIDGNKKIKRQELRSIRESRRIQEEEEQEIIYEEKSQNDFEMEEVITKTNYDKFFSKRKVVYTCILGGYDKLYSPLITSDNTEYIVFSDDENIANDTKYWKYREIPSKVKEMCNNNTTLINRYIKMHPHILFPEAEFALYVDGNIRVISDITSLFGTINENTGLAMHSHSRRNDVYEEAEACIKGNKGIKQNIIKQMEKYKEEGFPRKFGLFEANVIASDLKNENSIRLLNYWWDEFLKSNTLRDQIIFPYILWKSGYIFEDLGCLGPYMDLNPKFRRYIHNII